MVYGVITINTGTVSYDAVQSSPVTIRNN